MRCRVAGTESSVGVKMTMVTGGAIALGDVAPESGSAAANCKIRFDEKKSRREITTKNEEVSGKHSPLGWRRGLLSIYIFNQRI